jgi:hypothetical protein
VSLLVPNASTATQTKLRTPRSRSALSGMCATCLDGCPGLCEVGMSAFRATEVLYPQPFGSITAGAEKEYPVDLSDFNIAGTAVGAVGVEADSDAAVFPKVDLSATLGRNGGLQLALPFVIPGLGSTDIALNNWEELAVGSALSGTVLTIGENVVGMDDDTVLVDGRVTRAPTLEHRIRTYIRWQQDGLGGIVLQENVEDRRMGVLEYAIGELGVENVELKWGQGAKNIGGEVKIRHLSRADRLKGRGYIVLPDPQDPAVAEAYERGALKEFERHSRIGMVTREDFLERVETLRRLGAKRVFLKTGAYRPADLARAIKFCSEAEVDVLTVDGAGGGTGMSPWHMMNEWGIPPVEITVLARNYCERLAGRGEHVPDLVVAGGVAFEDQILKLLALGAPYVKAVGMARAPLAAAMVGKNIGKRLAEGNLDSHHSQYGNTLESIFLLATHLRAILGPRAEEVPPGALGLYSYYQRLAQGLRQLMCGTRKFALRHVDRSDIFALTRQAAEISGVSYVMDVDREEVEEILG